MRSKLLLAVGVTLLVYGLAATVIGTNTEIELKQLDIRTKQSEINDLNKQIDELEADDASDQKKLNEIKKENERLQTELQAKRAREAEAAQNAVYAASVPDPAPVDGDCQDWMSQAGIPRNYATTTLIINESGCNPYAINPESGACGIPQALPCSKLPCELSDPVCQLKWMDQYVASRYQTWQGALDFWHCIGQCSWSGSAGTWSGYKGTTWY